MEEEICKEPESSEVIVSVKEGQTLRIVAFGHEDCPVIVDYDTLCVFAFKNKAEALERKINIKKMKTDQMAYNNCIGQRLF